MKRILLGAAVVLGLASCTKSQTNDVGCSIQKAVTGTVTVAIAQQLECTNQAAIQASLDAAAAKAGICTSEKALAIGKKPDLKSIGGDICNTVASTLVASLVSGTIPAEWGCSGGAASSALQTLAQNACNKAFP